MERGLILIKLHCLGKASLVDVFQGQNGQVLSNDFLIS